MVRARAVPIVSSALSQQYWACRGERGPRGTKRFVAGTSGAKWPPGARPQLDQTAFLLGFVGAGRAGQVLWRCPGQNIHCERPTSVVFER
jgi:hypothetical protein